MLPGDMGAQHPATVAVVVAIGCRIERKSLRLQAAPVSGAEDADETPA